MNDLILIPNMNSPPFEELFHSENNTDVECGIDDGEMEALFDHDNPFVGKDMDEKKTPEEGPAKPVQIKRRCNDYGPGPSKLQWYYYLKDALDNYAPGKTIISADTNSISSKKNCVLHHDEIEPLLSIYYTSTFAKFL